MDTKHVKITPTNLELELFKQFFSESSYMGGTRVKYQTIKSRVLSDISDEYYEWNDPIELDIIYDERPKVSLLKRLNWFTEDPSIQPKIMYIPSKVGNTVLNVRRGDLVSVINTVNSSDENIFQVSEVRTELVYYMFICNIVPFRRSETPTEGGSKNNKWLNV